MSVAEETPSPARRRVPVHPMLWLMIAVMAGIEVMFAAADAGWVPEAFGRTEIYYRFAFLDILFDHWRGIQRIDIGIAWPEDTLRLKTFVTHAFLHGGWLHLAMNGAIFLALGHAIVQAIGIVRFLATFAVCAIAGALAFGLIAEALGPMVGASGAVFGMFAMVTAWQERSLRLTGSSRAPIWRRIGGLVALNVVMAIGLQGLLAWEAHLGGWVAGWLMAGVFLPQPGRLRPAQT